MKSGNIPKKKEAASSYGKIIDRGFLLLLFLLPLIVSPWNYSIFALPQIIFLRLLTLFILTVWLLKMLRTGEVVLERSPLNLPLIAFIFIAAISTFVSPYRIVSFYGRIEEYQGFFTIANYILICFLAFTLIKKERLATMIGAIMLSTSVMALYGIFQHYGLDFMKLEAPDTRSWATLGNPIFLGGHLALVLPLSIAYLIFSEWKQPLRWLSLVTLMVSLPALMFTLTRAAWLGFGVGLVLLISLAWREFLRKPRAFLWLGAPLILLLLVIYVDMQFSKNSFFPGRVLSIFSLTEEGGRLRLWMNILPLLLSRPLIGWGPSTFFMLTSLGGSGGTHNDLLNLNATMGFLGTVAYLTIIGIFFTVAIRTMRRADDPSLRVFNLGLTSGCFAYLTHLLFSFSFLSTTLLFWLLIGFATGSGLDAGKDSLKFVLKTKVDYPLAKWVLSASMILAAILLTLFISKPLIADLHFKRALGLESEGNLEQAVKEYEQTLKWNSQDEFYLTVLGRAYIAMADQKMKLRDRYLEKAVVASNRALALNPNSIDAHLNLGIINAYYGFPESAIIEWKKVTSFKKDHPDAHRFLGQIYERLGQLEKAKESYQEAIRFNPDDIKVREALARLEKQKVR